MKTFTNTNISSQYLH